jgi:very-short-patch-repair endonuclease
MSHLTMTEEQFAAYQKRMSSGARVVRSLSKHENTEPDRKRIQPSKATKPPSEIEASMWAQIKQSILPEPRSAFNGEQVRPIEGRKFRLDFAWPDKMVALEVDGAVHRIKGTFKASFERDYLLKLHGWTVLHVGGDEVRNGKALQWIQNIYEIRLRCECHGVIDCPEKR